MKKLGEEIRTGQLKQIYLLCGDEAYLRRQYRDRIKDALMGEGDLMNLHCFEGKGIEPGEVIDLAETMPFLAERRVLVIENSGFLKKGGEALAEYLPRPKRIRITCVIFYGESRTNCTRRRNALLRLFHRRWVRHTRFIIWQNWRI